MRAEAGAADGGAAEAARAAGCGDGGRTGAAEDGARGLCAPRSTAGEPGPEGVDAVTFTVATNPGAPAGPLNRIASGGELSRFLLALKVCLTRRQRRA